MSVRTAEKPMAFETGEFVFGAFLAWATFMVLMLGSLAMASVLSVAASPASVNASELLNLVFAVLCVAFFFGGLFSVGATLVVAPIAAWLSHRLEHVRDLRMHLAVYAGLGAVIGALFSAVLATAPGWTVAGIWAIALVTTVICATATAFGWWCAARRAWRHDRKAEARAACETAGSALA